MGWRFPRSARRTRQLLNSGAGPERLIGETIEGRGRPQFLDRPGAKKLAPQPAGGLGTDPVTKIVRRDPIATHDTERLTPANPVLRVAVTRRTALPERRQGSSAGTMRSTVIVCSTILPSLKTNSSNCSMWSTPSPRRPSIAHVLNAHAVAPMTAITVAS